MKVPEFIDVAGRRLRHRIAGEGGDAVVMLHGFGGSLETWAANQDPLAAEGWTVAALDLPGHGESSLDVGSGSLDDLAAVVLGYLDAVGIRRAHFIGHSMGAALSLVIADGMRSRVQSLVLIGPAGIGQKINAEFIRGYLAARSREDIEPLLRLLYADAGRVGEDLLRQVVAYRQRDGSTEALARIASSRYAATPAGRSLRDVAGTVPTLMIWGVADAMIPPPAPGDFVRENVLIRVLPRCGHMVQVEDPAEVNRLIDGFLRA